MTLLLKDFLSAHPDLTVHLLDGQGRELDTPDYQPQVLDFTQDSGNVHFDCGQAVTVHTVEIRAADTGRVWAGDIDPPHATGPGLRMTIPLGRTDTAGTIDL